MPDQERVCNEFVPDEGDPTFCDHCRRSRLMHEGVFWHKCELDWCEKDVEFDDEPFCFEHSPDSGSSVPDYSARERSKERE